ncbi:MAG: phenylacetate--CoA ligase family protein [Phycisphaeraceae bacterium]
MTTRNQTATLRALLRDVFAGNAFYRPILESAGLGDVDSITLDHFTRRVPLTTKAQLVEDQQAHPPYGTNLSFPIERYTRFCQTSGTTGRPMRVIDTPESWQGLLDVWKQVFEHAGCVPGDRVLFAFSFGPFLGFWTAYDAAAQLGLMCLPGGGLSSSARLQMIADNAVTTVCCTPTYAMHLAEVAMKDGFDLPGSTVKRLIVAGEPGGSVPAVRDRIASAWGAQLYDHHGMTEVGPVTYQDNEREGCLRIASGAFIAEVVDPQTGEPMKPGERGELVLTTLKRAAWPLLRYRTGDLVQQDRDEPSLLVGGVLGRVDDMRLVRGVNVYPSAVDAIVRRFDGVAEYQVVVHNDAAMSELTMTIEPAAGCGDVDSLCKRVAGALRDALSLRVAVSAARPGALPRYELKATRWREVSA